MAQSNLSTIISLFNNEFFNAHYKDNKVVISPLSVTYAMLMTYFGTSGRTREELKRALGIPNVLENELFKNMMQLNEFYNNKLKLANGIFVQHDFKLNYDYESMISKIGEINPVVFSDPQTITDINNWISDATEHLINNMLSSNDINSDTFMVIVNAIYFKMNWLYKFENNLTHSDKFTQSSGECLQLDFMSLNDKRFGYYKNDELQMIELPYTNDFYFGIMMPENLNKFYNPSDYFSKLKYQNVDIRIPKFKQEFKISMVDIFKNLGVNDLFVDANLSNMTPENGIKYVSNILHKVIFIVDENGTEAVAVTCTMYAGECCMMKSGDSIKFIADRTFQFYIRDSSNNIIFCGVFDG